MEIYYARQYLEIEESIKFKNDSFLKLNKIPLGTVFKNIHIKIHGKVCKFSTLILSSFDSNSKSLNFVAKRRGIKGSGTLTLCSAEAINLLGKYIDLKKEMI
jgi:hypothetical protein